jgi:hypothetical protein
VVCCEAWQPAQRAKLIAADRMRRWLAILCPADMQRSGPEIYLGPFQIADLRGPLAVPIGDQNHRSISVTVVIVLCGLDQLLNLSLGQMVARPIGRIGLRTGKVAYKANDTMIANAPCRT